MNVDITTYSDVDHDQTIEVDQVIDADAELHLHVRSTAESKSVWIDATSENGMVIVTGEQTTDTSMIRLLVPYTTLRNLPAGDYVHSLILYAGGVRTEVWRGTWTHNAGATRWNT